MAHPGASTNTTPKQARAARRPREPSAGPQQCSVTWPFKPRAAILEGLNRKKHVLTPSTDTDRLLPARRSKQELLKRTAIDHRLQMRADQLRTGRQWGSAGTPQRWRSCDCALEGCAYTPRAPPGVACANAGDTRMLPGAKVKSGCPAATNRSTCGFSTRNHLPTTATTAISNPLLWFLQHSCGTFPARRSSTEHVAGMAAVSARRDQPAHEHRTGRVAGQLGTPGDVPGLSPLHGSLGSCDHARLRRQIVSMRYISTISRPGLEHGGCCRLLCANPSWMACTASILGFELEDHGAPSGRARRLPQARIGFGHDPGCGTETQHPRAQHLDRRGSAAPDGRIATRWPHADRHQERWWPAAHPAHRPDGAEQEYRPQHQAFEDVLEHHPEHHKHVVFIAILVPSARREPNTRPTWMTTMAAAGAAKSARVTAPATGNRCVSWWETTTRRVAAHFSSTMCCWSMPSPMA